MRRRQPGALLDASVRLVSGLDGTGKIDGPYTTPERVGSKARAAKAKPLLSPLARFGASVNRCRRSSGRRDLSPRTVCRVAWDRVPGHGRPNVPRGS